jgi:two-component sensor histidine kinase
MQHIHDALDSAAYMAHGYCLLWKPWLVGLHVISDALIALSYTLIPLAILIFLSKRRFKEQFATNLGYFFCAFIMLCGFTHVASIVTLWNPWYEMEGYLKAVTATISIITAIVIFPLIPKALKIPTRSEYEKVIDEFGVMSETIEEQVHRRTSDAENKSYEMQHRVKNLLSVILGIAHFTYKESMDLANYQTAFLGRMESLQRVHESLVRNDWSGLTIHDVINTQLAPFNIHETMAIEGPEIDLNASQAQYLALALHELASNSTKYANKSGVGARYALRWNVIRGTFKFMWNEKTSRAIPTPAAKGFGHRLLLQIVPQAFNGNSNLTFGTFSVDYVLNGSL